MAFDSGLTPSDIKDVFDTTLSNGALNVWISAAEERVGDLPSHDDLTSARKTEITRFLTAALATAQDPRVDEERHESAQVSYEGERLTYMETAAMLDPTGTIGGESGDAATIESLNVRTYDGDLPGED